jgi:hypothetical protein
MQHAKHAYEGVELQLQAFLPSPLDRGWLVLYPPGRSPATRWSRGLVGAKDGLDAIRKKIILCLCLESNSGSLVFLPVVVAIPSELISASNAKSALLCLYFHLLWKGWIFYRKRRESLLYNVTENMTQQLKLCSMRDFHAVSRMVRILCAFMQTTAGFCYCKSLYHVRIIQATCMTTQNDFQLRAGSYIMHFTLSKSHA